MRMDRIVELDGMNGISLKYSFYANRGNYVQGLEIEDLRKLEGLIPQIISGMEEVQQKHPDLKVLVNIEAEGNFGYFNVVLTYAQNFLSEEKRGVIRQAAKDLIAIAGKPDINTEDISSDYTF
ncbi:MAG: hypothetical protein KJ709_03565 [Nanoarchaeota archaeon]|nr:hypothetical protein [Nanoarchaeota archaeon]